MTSYLVQWTMVIEAESHGDAALQAQAIQRHPASIATVFEVTESNPDGLFNDEAAITIDLSQGN